MSDSFFFSPSFRRIIITAWNRCVLACLFPLLEMWLWKFIDFPDCMIDGSRPQNAVSFFSFSNLVMSPSSATKYADKI